MNEDLRVLFEDNHILAVVKPPGLLTQGDITGDSTLLDSAKAYIKEKYDKPGEVYMGLVHRLDRPTGGVVVLCRTSKAASRLSEQFRNRTVEKTYLAVCRGRPKKLEGTLVHHLRHHEELRKTYAEASGAKGSKVARLSYRVLHHDLKADESLLEVNPETGRKHQIRCQLAAIGHPIKADVKYSGLKDGKKYVKSIGLWASEISIKHPVRKTKQIIGCYPDFENSPIWSNFAKTLSSLACREG